MATATNSQNHAWMQHLLPQPPIFCHDFSATTMMLTPPSHRLEQQFYAPITPRSTGRLQTVPRFFSLPYSLRCLLCLV
jgi:hypothetical protein